MKNAKVGDRVHLHPIISEPHNGKVYVVREVGTIPSAYGKVVWLEGKAGCWSLDALSPASPEEG